MSVRTVPVEFAPRGLFYEACGRSRLTTPLQRGGRRKARAGGQRIDNEVRQPRVTARRPELQDLDRGGHRDRNERGGQAIAPVGEPEDETDENESERVLAVLAEIGMRTEAWRPEGRKSDGG